MYRQPKKTISSINRNTSYQGETIEQKVNRITNNKEPIKDGAPLIYTDRQEGVQAGYNIRTDRFLVAVEAMDKVNKAKAAKRDSKGSIGDQAKEGMKKEENTGGESIHTTGENPKN